MLGAGIDVLGDSVTERHGVLSSEAMAFVAALHRQFNPTRESLLAKRVERQEALDRGERPTLLPETAHIRANPTWHVTPRAPGLPPLRIEITGPADRKMMINALNSGASTFMADLEDSLSPTWANVLEGHANLIDAVAGRLTYTSPEGKAYRVEPNGAVLLMRPRGWHLLETHVHVDGKPVSASLFDFGVYVFHNARDQARRGTGPFLYLPKMESHLEARLWNDVFVWAQRTLDLPRGTIRATVLIETILAAFEMEEILYELRDHSAGLNAGRWDYIFSIIKKFRNDPAFILPDRAQVSMTVPFMRAYTGRLVETCHRRGAQAIGGMAAFIPSRKDEQVNRVALAKVREDKQREMREGFDGTWVAHPDLVSVARGEFDKYAPATTPVHAGPTNDDAANLVAVGVPNGYVSTGGVRTNIRVALQYLASWIGGLGAVGIDNLMEDAATAEISRAQLWQWRRHEVPLADGGKVTRALYEQIRTEELTALRRQPGGGAERWDDAQELLDHLVLDDTFVDFLTIAGSRYLA